MTRCGKTFYRLEFTQVLGVTSQPPLRADNGPTEWQKNYRLSLRLSQKQIRNMKLFLLDHING